MNTAESQQPPITITLPASVDFAAMAKACEAREQTLEEFTAEAINRHLQAGAADLGVTFHDLCGIEANANEMRDVSEIAADYVRCYVESMGEQADDSVTSIVTALGKLAQAHADLIEAHVKKA